MKLKNLMVIGLWFFITACENEEANPARPTFDLTTIYPYHGFEGETINIWGVGFDSIASGNIVLFDSVEAKIEKATATNLTVQVPKTAKNGKITVIVGDKSLESGGDFIVLHEAWINNFNPDTIKTDTVVTITGFNFEPNFSETIVKFGEKTATVKTVAPTELTVVAPKDLAESGKVSVTINGRTVISTGTFIRAEDSD